MKWWVVLSSLVLMVLISFAFAWVAPPEVKAGLERAALVATAAGPLIVIVSTAFLILQIRHAASALRGQLFDATAGRMLDLTRVFVESPEVRKFFYEGVSPEEATEPLKSKVYAVAELHLDFFDTELLRKRAFRHALRDVPDVDHWIRDMLASSPAMSELLREDARRHHRWYDEIHKLDYSVRLRDKDAR